MIINNELFTRRPLDFEIPNDGVTNVDRPDDSKQWKVLEYELTSFVCEGEYEHGLERILDSYIRHRSSTTQPAVWVSGFYGSGKSHLVRVLQHLWADTTLPTGASACGLVSLPQGIKDQLVELSTVGKRDGAAPWSAAGALDRSGDTLNAVFLAIVLRAAGLPTRVEPAQVALWLESKGDLDAVRAHVQANGADFIEELSEYNLSTRLADAILAVDPSFASTGADVRKALRSQFPPDARALSTDETIVLLRKVLQFVGGGVFPPTLIVLDEVQQYISGDGGRAMEVQNLVESVSQKLDGRVLLVATGQQELTADATLQKIQDRFTVKVVLKNQDVDAVVRRVLLNKEPAARSTLEKALADVTGQISRQLAGSKIQHTTQDDKDLPQDYPLLPSRRRFWESVLRQADAGRAGQLRSQLRIVHDANRLVASKPVGTVVGADYLYAAKHEDLNGAGLLLKETQRLIHEQGQNEPLRGRILGLIHLISLLPTTPPGDIGVRATVDHLVDLLVEDLANDGTALRQEVPEVLASLTNAGILQQDGDEYQLQTAAGRTWDEAFRRHSAQLTDSEISTERDTRLRNEVENALPKSVLQGKAKVARRLVLHTDNAPPLASNTIPVWLRSEWDDGTTAKQFEDLVRSLGTDSPVVLVHLPRIQAQAFAVAWRNQMAAQRTLDQQGIPQDDEGKQARRAMESRLSRAQGQVSDHIRDILSNASVQLGGGSAPAGTALRDRIDNGAQSATMRLFSKFDAADDAHWGQVIDRIKKGSGADALKAVGYDAVPEQHPVVKEILGRIGSAGTPASDVEKAVLSEPFGWPRDALMGAIGVLLDNGLVRATINGSDASTSQVLSQTRLGTVHLRRESTVLKTAEKIAARSLLSKLGVPADNESLVPGAEQAVIRLAQRAGSIGGPAPLPDVAPPSSIEQIKSASGNDRVHALLAAKDELTDFADRLDAFEKRRPSRLEALATARALSSAAANLDGAAPIRTRLDAFEQTRELLSDTDQVSPIATDLASAVREAVSSAAEAVEQARQAAVDELGYQSAWVALDSDKQQQILNEHNLAPEGKLELGNTDAVLKAVQQRPLASWGAVLDAVPARAAKALEAAVRLTAPKAGTVIVPTATLSSAEDIETYLSDLRSKLTQALSEHDTVMVKG
ncbi:MULTISPECIES: BREX system P-loop protein BrxC [Rhodococcus]|uniref:BREX system P-loop protein BrxC n=1 Tax=Rhodococcus TaxID=1827 RepID=UPI00193B7474|nr:MULTISPECIES: BREX system P-loop protein BrxC [Rhodococcus]QRI75055.1 BREX system P-loop protein BrxC [Rhodococcus aetherivorans]QSE58464.1 BREX system P-loop protein BrxC [Rhodococcus sp. PSBB066]QSE70213.1 BREX system P-loop protein BrxC [Rhodococcus sp. PSBB049]